MDIPQEVKDEIINLSLNTSIAIKNILKRVSPEGNISIEDYYNILEEYQKKTGKRVSRGINQRQANENVEDSILIELCKKGYTNNEIKEYLIEKGYAFSRGDVETRVKEIYNKYNFKRRHRKVARPKKQIEDDEIYKLYNQGMTYKAMSEYFASTGRKISTQALNQRVHKIYELKGQKVPKIRKAKDKTKSRRKENRVGYEQAEIVFELRQKKMSYKDITKYFRKLGYKTCDYTISKICKKIYEEKGLKEPTIRTKKNLIRNEQLAEMRKKGMTIDEIIEYYHKRGIDVPRRYVFQKCAVLRLLESSNKQKGKMLLKEVTDEDLKKLREQRMSYKKIKEYYDKIGIHASISYYATRGKKLEQLSKVDLSSIPKEKLNEILLNLKVTKNATDYQLQQMSSFYGFDYNTEEKINPYVVYKDEER